MRASCSARGSCPRSRARRSPPSWSRIRSDYAAGAIAPSDADEDLHTFIERILTERLGPLGGKLRAGRSRNDQAANDLRLYLRREARALALSVLALQEALADQAARHLETLAPGFTHLQPAQPIVFAHQLLAHAQAVDRDIDRLIDWDRRSARSPLGAAALAGSAIALHPELAAAELGYDGPCENSIDAVGSRDHVVEFVFVNGHARRGPVAAVRGDYPLGLAAVRMGGARRRLRDRQLDHAAEEEPGHRRADARPQRRASSATWSALLTLLKAPAVSRTTAT